VDGVRSKIFTRRMLGIHSAAIVGIAACGLLGRWQWDRAAVTHSAQNGFYALEWWSFAIILAVVWVRTVQDELRPAAHPDAPTAEGQATSTSAAAAAVDAEADEEMAAYNGYLAWLAANPRD
jgi:DNA-binding transcriptional regulator of glucitol operon